MFEAVLAAIGGAIQAWNHERGKTEAVERVQLGLDIARAKDNKAAATAAMRVADALAEQMTDDELDTLAARLARAHARRKLH